MKLEEGDRVLGKLNKLLGTVKIIGGGVREGKVCVVFDNFGNGTGFWNEKVFLTKIIEPNDIMKELCSK